ncbi:MAG TPA: hypothetical protein VGI28_16280 [Stellaceae bacterium]
MKNCGDKKVDRIAILNAYYEEHDGFDRHKLNTDRAFNRSAQFHERTPPLQEHRAAGIGAKTPTSSKAMEMEQQHADNPEDCTVFIVIRRGGICSARGGQC